MARSYWSISYQASGGGWVADGNIPRPNENFNRSTVSNTQVMMLADGSKAFVTPEVYYQKGQLGFVWYHDDGTYKTKIEDYIKNHEYLKITTHLAEDMIGRFISITATHLIGISPDAYDIEAGFEVIT